MIIQELSSDTLLESTEIAGMIYTGVEREDGHRELWVHPVEDSRGGFIPYATADEIRVSMVAEVLGDTHE